MSSAPLASPAPRPPTRVMIVDDSAVARALTARWLRESGAFDVVCEAPDGRAALEALDATRPDIMLLDLHMPGMDGVEALPIMLRRRPGLRVVVVSTLTRRSAELSLHCLALGAVDCIPKPRASCAASAAAEFRAELIRKLKGLAGRSGEAAPVLAAARRSSLQPRSARTRCVLLGASTGGPRAVEAVLSGMGPALARVPVLVVQHMPPRFTAVFAERLSDVLGLPAREAEHGEPLVPGRIYVAPGGCHMGLSGDLDRPAVRLDAGPPVNFCRPAVDVLFLDAAAVFGSAALAVVLTGMGSDGTEGARRLARAGAAVLAQDERTSIIWGMPGSVAKAGLAEEVLPLAAMGPAVRTRVEGPSA